MTHKLGKTVLEQYLMVKGTSEVTSDKFGLQIQRLLYSKVNEREYRHSDKIAIHRRGRVLELMLTHAQT